MLNAANAVVDEAQPDDQPQPAEQLQAAVEPILDTEPPPGSHQFLKGIVQARKQAGRKATGVLWDLIRLSIARRRIFNPERYFHFRLFEYGSKQRASMDAFVDHQQRHSINQNSNCETHKDHAINHKQYLETILRESGMPVVRTQAILRSEGLSIGKIHAGKNAAMNYLRSDTNYPAFGKPVDGSLSLGVASIDNYDAASDSLLLSSGRRAAVTQFVDEAIEHYGDYGYLIQSRLKQQAELESAVGRAISCVRIVTLRDSASPKALYAVWKISAESSAADNIWREGNLCAAVDLETGRVTRCRGGEGVDCVEHELHPVTGAQLIGMRLPFWKEVLAVAQNASEIMSYTDIIGWDIAITDDGPVIVEGNTNPDHGLYQFANQQGLLETEFGEALVGSGKSKRKAVEAKAKAKTKRELRQQRKHIMEQGFKLD
ncbi:MAG: sugar-transfer associated ATP-grasp domain-containing protein [Pseudomonadales bacterium]